MTQGFISVADAGLSQMKEQSTEVEPHVIGARRQESTVADSEAIRLNGRDTESNHSCREEQQSSIDVLGDKDIGATRAAARKRSRAQLVLRHTSKTVRVLVRMASLGMMGIVFIVAVINWPPYIIEDEMERIQTLSALFMSGLFVVAVEDFVGINKSAIMMLLAATMWTFLAVGYHPNQSKAGASQLHHELDRGLKDVGSVVLFLLPAMGVVETIDHFDGFAVVTRLIQRIMANQRERLLPIICLLTFFLSAVIDNLTSTIVALKILRHVAADDRAWRRECGGLAVMAANAGGAWSPIGDVTTTMLWIQGKITAIETIKWLFAPSFVAGVLPLFGVWWQVRQSSLGFRKLQFREPRGGDVKKAADHDREEQPLRSSGTNVVVAAEELDEKASDDSCRNSVLPLVIGIFSILLVPALKIVTGLPPYLGMLLALSLMWLITDALHLESSGTQEAANRDQGEENALQETHCTSPPLNGVVAALHKVDLTGLLFFTGVLLSVGALDSAGVLHRYAVALVDLCGHSPLILSTLLGVSSALVDNVPLVEATIDMFKEVGQDDPLWQLTALAAGTGGSILSIGSIAGVTLMSMEGVSFFTYMRRVSLWALLGFAGGIATYELERIAFG